MNNVECLIVSSTIDYATDLICVELLNRNKNYLRINRDCFNQYSVIYSLDKDEIVLCIDGEQYLLSNMYLKSIYFRAPVFIRSNKAYSIDEQLYRSQWSSFLRNLVVFDKAKWMNHPVNTYLSENKIYQLKMAKSEGLLTPKTFVCNALPKEIENGKNYIVKSLDTALFYDNQYEYFTYSIKKKGSELSQCSINDAPVILQECLENKIDLRITVVGNVLFPVSIENNFGGIDGDWRKTRKEDLRYRTIELPKEIQNGLRVLVSNLGLVFAGIDMAFIDGDYYFVEANPTGEWAWLQNALGIRIDKAIVDYLTG